MILDSLDHADLIVVGSGLYGLTVAREAADAGHTVAVLEARDHIGGNAWSSPDPDTGIEVHRYGSHIFHTSNERVWTYLNRFAAFNDYRHHGWTVHDGRVYPMPICLTTISEFVGRALSPEEARAYVARCQEGDAGIDPESSLEAKAISLIGRPLYRAFIQGYTQKQWQTDPKHLPAATITRLPVRYTHSNRYFNDRYEGIPIDGYGQMLLSMAAHPRIRIHLRTDYFQTPRPAGVPVVYTGPLDRYFDYRLGHLGWRTLDLQSETLPVQDFQGAAIMNYADPHVPWTRIHEHRHYTPERRDLPTDRTIITREFSRRAERTDEPYYPINGTLDRTMLNGYRRLAAEEPNTHFGGRLGTYQYLDMHMAVAAALTDWQNRISPDLTHRARTLRL